MDQVRPSDHEIMAERPDQEKRVLMLTQTKRDATLSISVLTEAGLVGTGCADLAELCRELEQGAGCLLMAESVLLAEGVPCLAEALGLQPAWSDLPVIVLTRGGAAESPRLLSLMEALGNAALLELPVRISTLLSALRAALKARARQYQIRDYLVEQQQDKEALKDADRRKDEFLAMLAHELRNPLAPIRYAAQMLHMNGLAQDQIQKQHEVIDRQVSHMGRLLDDLLEVSRITRGKIQLKREIVDLRSIATQALDSIRPMIEGRGQHLLYEGPSSPLPVDGDPTRLEQIIRNLLHNANKYTEAGGCIKLSLGLETEKVWRAAVRVSDSGIGIAPEMLPRVFELFSQAAQPIDRPQGGLGIGLAMVKNLVQMHGGSVEAQSAGLGQGSEFIVRLPLAAAALGGLKDVSALQEQSPGAPSKLRRVLVVDDNEDSAASLGELLSLWGHEIQTAHDGKHALAAAREWQPEIILLDIGLPGMDGYEVARFLREDPATSSTILVALTGYGQEEDRRRSQEAGFNQHLTKPVELDRLQAVLSGLHAA